MDFKILAAQAQKELDDERARLRALELQLSEKASTIASSVIDLDKKTSDLTLKERELQQREERVSARELSVRRDVEVQKDLETSITLNREAVQERKKAQELRDQARMDLEDLEKREVALSEREKVYKQEIEHEVLRNFTFRK